MGGVKPNLSAIKRYDDIANISKFEDIMEKIKNYIEVSDDEIEEEYERLKSDAIRYIRGKYMLEKMPKCIQKIEEESNKGANHEGDYNTSSRRSSRSLFTNKAKYCWSYNSWKTIYVSCLAR